MKNYYLTIISIFLTASLFAQQRVKKVEFYGGARTNILFQSLDDDSDTVNVQKSNYGHSLIDLGILVRPSSETEIVTELRMRNELGGFYGAAVSFGVRRLTLKGVVNESIRYKIGDIDLKLTPFTLHNNDYDDRVNEANVFRHAREVIDYENFYGNNTWRRQGIQTQFGLDLMNEHFKSLNVNLFSTRNNTANGQLNIPERLYSGGSVLLNSSFGKLAFNSANMHDLKNTISDNQLYYNYVNSFSASIPLSFVDSLSINFEGGMSSEKFDYLLNDDLFKKQDYFWNFVLEFNRTKTQKLSFSTIYTGPFFRSLGAQNIRLDYQSISEIFPGITNNQVQREMGLFDYLYNDVFYRKTFDNVIDQYNPSFSNVLPYGIATPNRKGFSFSGQESFLNQKLSLSTNIHALQEVLGSGTTELKRFLKASVIANANYRKWNLVSGFTYEKTNREGLEFKKVDLSSLLLDFGLDYEITDNVFLMYGAKYHKADGYDFIPSYNSQNQILFFNTYTVDNQIQALNALGLKVAFSTKSTLTLSYNSYLQERNIDYKVNQFHVLYRLNL
jgi:hypothetical protein